MNCKKCGSPLPEGGLFCGVCGERVTAEPAAPSGGFFSTAGGFDGGAGQPVSQPRPTAPQGRPQGASGLSGSLVRGGQNAQQQPPVQQVQPPVQPAAFCGNCGAPMAPGSRFCGVCGAPAAGGAPAPGGDYVPAPAPKTKKSKKKLPLIIGAAALSVLLVVGIVLGILVHSVANGPAAKLYTSVKNTLNASSLTGELTYYRDGSREGRIDIEAVLSLKTEELTATISAEGETIAIYDGYVLEKGRYGVYKEDISSILDQIFEAYNSAGSSLGDTDVRKMLQDADPSGELYDIVSEVMDLDKLESCFKTLVKRLNDESWLKENAGFSKTKSGRQTTYSFKIGARFLRAVAEIFKPAFHSSEDYLQAMDELLDFDESLKFSYTVEGKYLTGFSYTTEGYHTYTYTVELTNIGHTQIDTDQLEYWLSIAE